MHSIVYFGKQNIAYARFFAGYKRKHKKYYVVLFNINNKCHMIKQFETSYMNVYLFNRLCLLASNQKKNIPFPNYQTKRRQ